jgi:hypothetical protein
MGSSAGTLSRNTAAMLASPRCGATTRAGGACRSPAVSGKKRCRMHGGAKGSGAPKGNTNALKNGAYTRGARERRVELRELLRNTRNLLRQIED